MSDSVELATPGLEIGASVDGELVFVGKPGATEHVFVDARTWPPVIVRHPGAAHVAARSVSGRWLVYASTNGAPYTLRWYDSITSEQPADELSDPIPPRDFSAAYAAVAHEERAMPALLHSQHPASVLHVESVHFVDELPILLPMHVGYGDDYRQPLIRRGNAWVPLDDLPCCDKELGDLSQNAPAESVRLADGTPAFAWHGCVYGYREGRFEPLFDVTFDQERYRRENILPSNRGVFVIDGATLVELGPEGRVERLVERRVTRLRPGPRGTVVVSTGGDGSGQRRLFDPASDRIASLDNMLRAGEDVVGATADHLLVHDKQSLRRIAFDELAKLPSEQASVPPPRAPARLALFDDDRPLSAARIAASGAHSVMAHRRQVRHFDVDKPTSLVELSAPVVAVACQPGRVAALDENGTLHVLDGAERLASAKVTTAPRTLLTTPDGRWLVVGGDRSTLLDRDAQHPEPIGFAGGVATAIDPDGTVVLVGDERRMACYQAGSVVDLPATMEQVIAIAPLGSRRFVCAGVSNLYVLDLKEPELELWLEGYTGPHLATNLELPRLAFACANTVFLVEIGGTRPRTIVQFERVETPQTGEFHSTDVTGLDYLGDGRLLVGLAFGGGTIIDLGGEVGLCLDPHPGDPVLEYLYYKGHSCFRWNSAEAAAP